MVTKQSRFAFMVAVLILFALVKGYQITFGDTWAKEGKGRKHKKGSFHFKRLAVDLNLFKDGVWLEETKHHEPLGVFWKMIGGTWGGDWDDGNHYSLGEE
jgi:hypothetical protein